MAESTTPIQELVRRARASDPAALQQLRESGYFANKIAARNGIALSPAQRRLWLLDQMLEDRAAYHMPGAFRLQGPLDTNVLRRALEGVVARHESLRTTFRNVDGDVRQFISALAVLEFEETDAGSEVEARVICHQTASKPFEFESGPLFRARLIRLGDEQHVFLFVLHHIIADAWSIGILLRETAVLYNALTGGKSAEASLPPLRFQYKDHASLQNEQLTGEEGAKLRDYWMQKLGGELPLLDLPTDRPRPPAKAFAAKTLFSRIDEPLAGTLVAFSRREGVTLFMTMTALVKVLIHRYTGAADIIVGTAVSGRNRVELESQIGFYINTVALRDTLSGMDSFHAVLQKVKQTLAEAYEHQMYPFDQLVADLRIERAAGRSPLFDVSVQLQHSEPTGPVLDGIQAEEFDPGFRRAKFDLSFDFIERDGELSFTIEFDTALFEEARVERMAGHVLQLARAATRMPDAPIALLEMLTWAERARLLAFNPHPAHELRLGTIAELFEACVEEAPENAAIIFEDDVVSYRELDRRANQLASFLRGKGVGPEGFVGVCMERSIEAIVAILAILKTGGVYVPLDPLLPPHRLNVIVEDCKPACILTHRQTSGKLPSALCVDALRDAIAAQPAAHGAAAGKPHNAAYLIYTSGSTGVPKGVLVEHRSYANMIRAVIKSLAVTAADRCLGFANCSFDASIFETFLALLSGASLVLVRREVIRDTPAFERYLEGQGVTLAVWPPSFLSTLDEQHLARLRMIVTAGEAASGPLAQRYAGRLRYINAYGPTEASVCSHWFEVERDGDYRFGVPIGYPLANTRSYILDHWLQFAPEGVPGEIWLAGAGLARGYLNRPAFTAESFVPDPFSAGSGERMYRTGDLGRYRSDGAIEFIGRIDSQVKLRGYRIELGEIEAALRQCRGVRAAAVTLPDNGQEPSRIVAYVAADADDFRSEDVRAHLRGRLPEYMVPTHFIRMDALPLNLSGKVDRKSLPIPDLTEAASSVPFTAPRNNLERLLAGMWTELLGVERIGIHDNFFELGGHSLLATRLVSRLRDVLKLRVSIAELFETATVARLAEALSRGDENRQQIERITRSALTLATLSDEQKQQLLARKRMQRSQASR